MKMLSLALDFEIPLLTICKLEHFGYRTWSTFNLINIFDYRYNTRFKDDFPQTRFASGIEKRGKYFSISNPLSTNI